MPQGRTQRTQRSQRVRPTLGIPAIAPANLIGPAILRLRAQRGWTQDQVVARLQVAGMAITRDVLANIELRRTACRDLIAFGIAAIFRVSLDAIYPPPPRGNPIFLGWIGPQRGRRHRRKRKDRRHRLRSRRQVTRRKRRPRRV